MDDLTLLGSGPAAAHGPEGLEAFPVPATVAAIELTSSELLCSCPVTGQPDVYELSMLYGPDPAQPMALETKSVKLWLWSYRDRAVFAEHIAAELTAGLHGSPAAPAWVEVTLRQNVRGGIVTTVTATEGARP